VQTPVAAPVYATINAPDNASSGYTDLLGSYSYSVGDWVTVNAYASSNWYFHDWKVIDVLTGTQYIYTNPINIQIADNMSITPEFLIYPTPNNTYDSFGNQMVYPYTDPGNPYDGDGILFLTLFKFTGGNNFYADNISLEIFTYQDAYITMSCCIYSASAGNGSNITLTLLGQSPFYNSLSTNCTEPNCVSIPSANTFCFPLSNTPLLVNDSWYAIGEIGSAIPPWMGGAEILRLDKSGYNYSCFEMYYNYSNALPASITANFSNSDQSALILWCSYGTQQAPTTSSNLPLDLIVFLLILLIPTYCFYNFLGSIAVPPSLMLMTAICWMGGIVPISVLLIVVIVSIAIMFRNPIRSVTSRVRGGEGGD
jgi:hypothetical protein